MSFPLRSTFNSFLAVPPQSLRFYLSRISVQLLQHRQCRRGLTTAAAGWGGYFGQKGQGSFKVMGRRQLSYTSNLRSPIIRGAVDTYQFIASSSSPKLQFGGGGHLGSCKISSGGSSNFFSTTTKTTTPQKKIGKSSVADADEDSSGRASALASYAKAFGQIYPSHEADNERRVDYARVKEMCDTLDAGERDPKRAVRVVGRIVGKRQAGQKLIFYTLATEHNGTLQVVASRADAEMMHVLEEQEAAAEEEEEKERKEEGHNGDSSSSGIASAGSHGQVVVTTSSNAPATTTAHAASHFKILHGALRRGSHVDVIGYPGRTKVGEASVFARIMRLTSPCLRDIPRTLTDPDIRMRHRALDMLVNPGFIDALKARAAVLRYLREFLDARGFIEVETPVLTPQAGGATARPFNTHAEALDRQLALRVAPELYLKQLVIGGMERVYELGRVFRNEGLDPTHNPEFTTCEFYWAYANFEDLTALTEELVCGMVTEVTGSDTILVARGGGCEGLNGEEEEEGKGEAPDIATIINTSSSNNNSDSNEAIVFKAPFARLSFMDTLEAGIGCSLPSESDGNAVVALLDHCRVHGLSIEAPHTYGALLDRLAGHFVEPLCVQPTFVTDHPRALSPLAKAHDNMPERAQRFELFVNGFEVANAYVELNDPEEQRARFRAQLRDRHLGDAEAALPDDEYCAAMEYGLAPTVGWGMGMDRMIMLLTQTSSIRDVLAFPMHRE